MSPAELALEAFALKHLARAGWLRVGVAAPESVAAHSWGMALLALLTCPAHLDRERVLAMCVLHDLAEVVVGDITPHDGVPKAEKQHRERAAAARLLQAHPELRELWEDYELQRSPEARFVKGLDRTDMGLQALRYAEQADTSEFLDSARSQALPPALDALLGAAEGERS